MTDRPDDPANTQDWPPRWVPPSAAALADIVALARHAVEWEADAFEADEPVAGTDAVAFLAEWRARMIDALARFETNKGSV